MTSTTHPPSGPASGRSLGGRDDAAGSASASGMLGEAGEAARTEAASMAERARAEAMQQAERGKAAGADAARSVAEATRAAADRLEAEQPQMARYAREAADMVDDVSTALRERSAGDLLRGVDSFARREPVAFFGAALAVGFAAARFLGSSARTAPSGGSFDAAGPHRSGPVPTHGDTGGLSQSAYDRSGAGASRAGFSGTGSSGSGAADAGHRPSAGFSPTPRTDGPNAFRGPDAGPGPGASHTGLAGASSSGPASSGPDATGVGHRPSATFSPTPRTDGPDAFRGPDAGPGSGASHTGLAGAGSSGPASSGPDATGVGHRPSATFSPTPKTDGPDAFHGAGEGPGLASGAGATRPAPEPIRSAGLKAADEPPTPRPSAADTLGRPASAVGDGAPSGASGTPGATPDRRPS